jgi:hypothetical protein
MRAIPGTGILLRLPRKDARAPADMTGMERRREPRLEIETPATLSRLDTPARPISAVVVNVSGLGLALRTPYPMPSHTPARLDWNGGLLLGEVVYSRREGAGFTLGVSIRHSLHDLAGLAAACEAFVR